MAAVLTAPKEYESKRTPALRLVSQADGCCTSSDGMDAKPILQKQWGLIRVITSGRPRGMLGLAGCPFPFLCSNRVDSCVSLSLWMG